MAIRLLCAYGGRPANSISTFDSATEAGLISAKMASANLTGGDVVFSNLPILALNQSSVISGSSTVRADEQQLIIVPEGQALSITGAPNTTGVVYRLNDALGGTNSDMSWPVAAGALATIGPYAGARRYLITCSAGSIVAAVGDAIVNVPQIVVSAASPNNADGRPDGTVYIQSAS